MQLHYSRFDLGRGQRWPSHYLQPKIVPEIVKGKSKSLNTVGLLRSSSRSVFRERVGRREDIT